MIIKVNGKDVELKFTYNSFKYMEDFDLTALSEIDKKPFKMAMILEQLMIGACNNNPKVIVLEEEIIDFLEDYISNNSIADLFELLMGELEKSNFFKSIQKIPEEAPKKKK